MSIFRFFPQKNKIVFVASFHDNNIFTYREIEKQNFPGEIVFLCKKNCYKGIKKSVSSKVFLIEEGKIFDEVMAAYHLSTAKTIIVDNYYGFLSVMNFRDSVECIQIWHAAGAIKNFGFMDRSVANRSNRAKKRYSKVYRNFTKVVVNSTAFANIFKDAFAIKDHQFLPFGFPRTDFYFDLKLQKRIKDDFYKKYPMFREKKIILYAPTFRPNKEQNKLKLDLKSLYQNFNQEFVLFIRLHPTVDLSPVSSLPSEYHNFVHDFSKKASINELLVVSNYLITDYSSIPFEFVLLDKPMIFYPYDLHEYQENPGIWDNYENIVPGPIAFSTDEIIQLIKFNQFDFEKYEEFKNKWNEFSKGDSSQKLAEYIINRHK